MNPLKAKSVIIDMAFGSRADYDRFSRDVQRDGAIEQTILRGRIAPDKTWMRLELRGGSHRIEDLVGRWDEFIVAGAGELEQAA